MNVNDEGQLPSEMWLMGTNRVGIIILFIYFFLKVMENTTKAICGLEIGEGIMSEADCFTKSTAKNE